MKNEYTYVRNVPSVPSDNSYITRQTERRLQKGADARRNELTQSKIMQVMDWTYDKAINGVPGFDSAIELAESYMRTSQPVVSQADELIYWQCAKAASVGFLTGLGGVATLPFTILTNVAGAYFVQIQMIAAIAHMGGYDVRDDKVRTMVYVCLTGNAAKGILKDLGIGLGQKAALSAIKKIPRTALRAINQTVGFKLFSKAGVKGVINPGKVIPLIGGFIGGAIDYTTTDTVGNIAKSTFLSYSGFSEGGG